MYICMAYMHTSPATEKSESLVWHWYILSTWTKHCSQMCMDYIYYMKIYDCGLTNTELAESILLRTNTELVESILLRIEILLTEIQNKKVHTLHCQGPLYILLKIYNATY